MKSKLTNNQAVINNMASELKQFMSEQVEVINKSLKKILSTELDMPENLYKSMEYSIEAGGKRVRPLLVLATLKDLNVEHEDAALAASAIELIHTYSLIHDDLPSMDDDDLRRGKPTNHIVFGEAMAILAGDAMQTLAFDVLANLSNTNADDKLALIQLLAKASGARGMVAGQVLDIEGEGQPLNVEQLQTIHANKTGALLSCCIQFGATFANLQGDNRKAIEQYAKHIGIAFQIQDDILDVTATTEELGKNAGSDESSDKTTYPMLLGLDGAKKQLAWHHEQAIQSLKFIENETSYLKQFADYIVQRSF